MIKAILVISVLLFGFAELASAQVTPIIPRNYLQGTTGLQNKVFGSSCFVMFSVVDSLPCTPSFLAENKDEEFTAQLFTGNNISHLDDANRLIDAEASPNFLREVFSQDNVLQVDGMLQASYRGVAWGFSFIPYRLNYVSLVRNQAYPIVTLHAAEEKIAELQLASYFENDLFGGVQFRYVDRKIVHQKFALFDVLAEGGPLILLPKEQDALYIEPSLHYAPQTDWAPLFAMSMVNVGFVDHKIEGYDTEPIFNLGGSFKPVQENGVWELGLNYLFDRKSDLKALDYLRFGTAYKLDYFQGLFSLDRNSYSLGLLVTIKGFRGSLSYEKQEWGSEYANDNISEVVFTQIGFVF